MPLNKETDPNQIKYVHVCDCVSVYGRGHGNKKAADTVYINKNSLCSMLKIFSKQRTSNVSNLRFGV